MGANSAAVHSALKDSLPEQFLPFITGGADIVTWQDIPTVTDKDSATIAMGILSYNLNAFLSHLFEQVTIPQLMCYAASLNPALEGLLLASLSLTQTTVGFTVNVTTNPITSTDPETGGVVNTGDWWVDIHITSTVETATFATEIPALNESFTSRSVGIMVDASQAVGVVTGKTTATFADGIQQTKYFTINF